MFLKRNHKPERRRSKRHWLSTPVQILAGSTPVDGLGVNLSDDGMCLFAIAHLPVGSQIEVEFLPPRCESLVRSSAIVRHRALYLYGIEFLGAFQSADASWTKRETAPLSL